MDKTTELNETVEIKIAGKSFELPVITGTYQEKAIDISKLRAQSGYITLDVGFKNTGSTTSSITYIDGAKGILEHRGYRIEQLADQATFLEVVWLLLKGELPTQAELDGFKSELKASEGLPDGVRAILDAMPDGTHPMGMLSAVLNVLTGYYPEANDSWTDEAIRWQTTLRALALMPEIAANIYRRGKKLPYLAPHPELGYVENFIYMMFGEVDPKIAEALDTLLVLHADHEQNCSASTSRFVGSSRVNLFASIAAANNALWGPLHGGANQAVLEMLAAIQQDGGDADKYIAKAKDKEDPFRLMGFGHRVYKNYDPRAKVIKKYVDIVLDQLNKDDELVDIAKNLEKAALADSYFADRKLFPNVDFYSGIIYQAMEIPVNMFTVMFALGRLPGWMAQWQEMRINEEPIGRPRQVYIGETTREYRDISDR
ncbi:MAG: citrate synthase [Bacteroidota bacterium]